MPTWKTTRSGYRYPSYAKGEWVKELGDTSTVLCKIDNCLVVTQGGERGFRDHVDQIHGGKRN